MNKKTEKFVNNFFKEKIGAENFEELKKQTNASTTNTTSTNVKSTEVILIFFQMISSHKGTWPVTGLPNGLSLRTDHCNFVECDKIFKCNFE